MRALLLQGPVGPFFATLQRGLRAQGWDTLRVVLDGGDLWFSGAGPTKIWSGFTPWESWLDATLDRYDPTLIVLFGAERPAHKVARALAKKRQIPVLCLEEGYLRPGFLTAEWGGNNHASPLHTLPLKDGPGPQPAKVKPGMLPLVAWSAIYYTARVLFSLPTQWSLYHRQYFWPAEVTRWGKNLLTRIRTAPADTKVMQRIANTPYDVLALQVPGDRSLVEGGDGWTTERLIRQALASFANHAPKDRQLVVKIHPLARGHSQDAALVKTLRTSLGPQDRVHILYGGPLAPLLDPARGLITITSTSALASIEKNKPTLVLGRGIARRAGLAQCGPNAQALDTFWTNDTLPKESTKNAFWHLLGGSLIPGDAYLSDGRAQAVDALIALSHAAATYQPPDFVTNPILPIPGDHYGPVLRPNPAS